MTDYRVSVVLEEIASELKKIRKVLENNDQSAQGKLNRLPMNRESKE